MIRFAHSEYLSLLALIPLMAVAAWLVARTRSRALARFGEQRLLERLVESASRRKRVIKLAILLAAVAFLVVGLADPQIGTRLEDVKQEGVDIFIDLDVSLSMKAEDIKPTRLDEAKLEIRNLISRLAGDRIGMVVFAGAAYVQFPLTTDYSAASLFLDAADVDVVPDPGTAIGDAIERSAESFDPSSKTSRVIVIISDGENTEGDAFEAAKEAAAKGILIYTVGMGTSAGSPIPIYNAAGQMTDFKRDRSGKVVVTKLDEPALERIASTGNGKYFHGSNSQDELDAIYKSINSLQKKEFGVKQFTDYEDRFQPFLAIAIALLILDIMLSEKRVKWIARWNLLRKEEGVKP